MEGDYLISMSKPKKKGFTVKNANYSNRSVVVDKDIQLDLELETYQSISDYFSNTGEGNGTEAFAFRKETMRRIEQLIERSLICYITKTSNVQGTPAFIDDSDLTGFSDLVQTTPGNAVDVVIVSNGGAPEATERIVHLLREKYETIRFIVPSNAFSAATLICFSGDEILMESQSSLGPIDPQVGGIPARAILRAFEALEVRLKEEGPRALTAYMPMLTKYDLHLLEICKSAEDLSKELASNWLSRYMLKCDEKDKRVADIVDFFSKYDIHKSHGRSIGRDRAIELGLRVSKMENTEGLFSLVHSLYNQHLFFFDKTGFYKLFENTRGISWGRTAPTITFQLPLINPQGMPQVAPPGPPKQSN